MARRVRPFRSPFRPQLVALEARDVPAAFTVSNVEDSGAGSFRQAVLDANANTEADTIAFDFGLGGKTVKLATPVIITDTFGLSINGSLRPILSGENTTRILEIAAGAKASIGSLWFTAGKGDNGAAIRNAGTLSLDSVAVYSNASNTVGGAVYNTGTFSAVDSEFYLNSAVISAAGWPTSGRPRNSHSTAPPSARRSTVWC